MSITRDRIRSIGGRCFDLAMGAFLVAVLFLIWNSSRSTANSAASPKATATKKVARNPNIEALTPLQGTTCVITCPANITAQTGGACAVVAFPPPVLTACSGGPVCTPPSGFCFPVGTTTVTCTAPDLGPAGGCSFNVTVEAFDVCLQDDSDPSIVFLGNSQTGAYSFCCGGTTYTGVAQVSRRGSISAFAHYAPDRRVQAISDGAVFRGIASLQTPPGTIRCTITDRDTRNNTCVCGGVPVD